MRNLSLLLLSALPLLAKPVVINDSKLLAALQAGVGEFSDDESIPKADALKEAVEKAPRSVAVKVESSKATGSDPADAVYMVGGVYKCGNCDKWHVGGVATAWALGSDGLMVTNHHVLEGAKGGALGVCDRKGNTYPVMEVLAADEVADMALFRVRAEGLTTVSLAEPAGIGTGVQVISHPNRRFFMHTFGEVSRYHLRPGRKNRRESTWMSITADYAKGSSGGPVLNADGQVVGMVASTQSIYYESNDGKPKGPLQMVVKNCVPVSSIATMIEPVED